MKFTVLGSSGFIGRHLCRHLSRRGYDVQALSRPVDPGALTDAGHVIYLIGLTGDFRTRPSETVEAHVSLLNTLLREATFSSWLYASSTRVYEALPSDEVAHEATDLPVRPTADALYNLTKLTGEAICLGHDDPAVRVARLSNVYGAGLDPSTFLGSVVEDVRNRRPILIREAPRSAKDYVAVDDVCALIEAIAVRGSDRLYNVASGVNTTHEAVADVVRTHTGSDVRFGADGRMRVFPRVSNDKVRREFGFSPTEFAEAFGRLLSERGMIDGSET